ncbi:MAG TPA: hypothetical protein VE177_00575 [Candidatus Binatus sp.]|nr:hypothetical protein [Candidatus Binatus sp.]
MAGKYNEVIVDSLANRWRATNATVGATCVAASPTLGDLRELHNLTSVNVSIANMSAAASTVTLSVRDASIAGTVLASLDIVTPAAAGSTNSLYFDLPGNRGTPISVDLGLLGGSVAGKLNICGWKEIDR